MKSKFVKVGAKKKLVYEMSCLICRDLFDSPIRTEPTCGAKCWRIYVGKFSRGETIVGNTERVHGRA